MPWLPENWRLLSLVSKCTDAVREIEYWFSQVFRVRPPDPSTLLVLRGRGPGRDPQQLAGFFLEGDDQLGLLELPLKPPVLPLQPCNVSGHSTRRPALVTRRLGRQPRQHPRRVLLAPARQRRAVKPLASQHRSQFTRRATRRFLHHPSFVRGAEMAHHRPPSYFRIGPAPNPLGRRTPLRRRRKPRLSIALQFFRFHPSQP